MSLVRVNCRIRCKLAEAKFKSDSRIVCIDLNKLNLNNLMLACEIDYIHLVNCIRHV